MKDKLDLWVRIGLILLVIVLNMLWPDRQDEVPVDPPDRSGQADWIETEDETEIRAIKGDTP